MTMEADIARLRRMTNEPDETTYTDEIMTDYITSWPIIDDEGRSSGEDNWTEAYDLHAAAADIWEEKAATLFASHDFSADSSSFSANQMYTNAKEMAEHHRARKKPTSKKVVKRPVETNTGSLLYNGIYANINPIDEDWNDIWSDL